ncbi:hypothetical protein PoB_006722100 [Plakobranchus ocellatus]|uniref:Uncharacterized protein n=1 Tax=Plakobranchus ocellatus TaxID=259542 RepID=A0AAV4D9J0_9GAST|nr:hypothetical protein PoB_006722100 [Plakobranchus ocellatus]
MISSFPAMNSSSILSNPCRRESPYAGECALKSPSTRKAFGNCLKSSAREYFETGVLGGSFEGERGHSIRETEALGELGVGESRQIEDVASSASIARGAKRLNVSGGGSCLLDFSARR